MFGIQGWVNPVDGGRISSPTGHRKAFRTKNGAMSSSLHHGIDWAAPLNTPIKSVFKGTVVQAGWINGYGNVVVVRAPDGTYAQYSHLNEINTQVGQQLSAGQELGKMGSTGNSTGSHLDLIIARNGWSLNEQGKPHTKTKPWLRDGGGTAASYRPLDPKNKALEIKGGTLPTETPVLTDPMQGAMSSISSTIQQLASLTGQTAPATNTAATNVSIPEDEKITEVDILSNPLEDLKQTTARHVEAFEEPQPALDTAMFGQPENDAHDDWIASLQKSIQTANYGEAQQAALEKMFGGTPDPSPSYGTMPEGVSSYIESLIKKA